MCNQIFIVCFYFILISPQFILKRKKTFFVSNLEEICVKREGKIFPTAPSALSEIFFPPVSTILNFHFVQKQPVLLRLKQQTTCFGKKHCPSVFVFQNYTALI